MDAKKYRDLSVPSSRKSDIFNVSAAKMRSMQDPSSPPASGLTCPSCNHRIKPGDKFCENCGAKIPVFFTCTRCGTQFIHPTNQCELCGGPLVLRDSSVPNESPEHAHDGGHAVPEGDEIEPEVLPDTNAEERTVPAMKKPRSRHKNKIPEPEPGEQPVLAGTRSDVSITKKTPPHTPQLTVEPDTQDLLEQYGKEYDPRETLASRPATTPPKKTGGEKTVPSRHAQRSAAPPDDALFMTPDTPTAPQGGAQKQKRILIMAVLALIVVAAAGGFLILPLLAPAGNPDFQGSIMIVEETPGSKTAFTGAATPVVTATPARASGALIPQPTQTVPSGQNLYFHVQKSPITAKILVTFAGSAGHGSLKSADVRVTHPEGSVASGMILPLKGISEIILDGSKGTDRVEILALMSDGTTYRVYDALIPFTA